MYTINRYALQSLKPANLRERFRCSDRELIQHAPCGSGPYSLGFVQPLARGCACVGSHGPTVWDSMVRAADMGSVLTLARVGACVAPLYGGATF